MPSCASIFISCSAEQQISTPLLILVQVETFPFMLCDSVIWTWKIFFWLYYISLYFLFFSIFLHLFSLILMYLCIRWKHFNASDCHWVLQAFVKTFFNLICNPAVSVCCLSLCFCSSRALPLLLSSCVCSLFSFIGSMFLSHWQNSKVLIPENRLWVIGLPEMFPLEMLNNLCWVLALKKF